MCYREIVQKNKFQSRIRSEVNVMKDFLMPIFLVSALIHTQKYTFRKTLRYPLVSYLIGKNTFSPSLEHQCWHVAVKCRCDNTKSVWSSNTIHKFIHRQKPPKLPKNTQKYTSFKAFFGHFIAYFERFAAEIF